MKIPRDWADGKTDLAPLIWDLMKRGEYEGFEGCLPIKGIREAILLCQIKRIPMTFNLAPEDAWPKLVNKENE